MWRSLVSSAHLCHLLRRLLLSSPPQLIRPIPPLSIPSVRSLSSSSASDLARSISDKLIKFAIGGGESNCLDLSCHLSLYFSGVRFTSLLLLEILNASPASGCAAADLYRWIVRSRSFTPSDESLSYLLHFLFLHSLPSDLVGDDQIRSDLWRFGYFSARGRRSGSRKIGGRRFPASGGDHSEDLLEEPPCEEITVEERIAGIELDLCILHEQCSEEVVSPGRGSLGSRSVGRVPASSREEVSPSGGV